MIKGRIHAFRREEKVSSYTKLASLYDGIMDHIDYHVWAEYINLLFCEFGNRIHRVVDGGCGTGSLANALIHLGYKVVGFDRSWEMIRIAHSKSMCPFWQGDLRSIGLSSRWDGFLCLYDTIQYLNGVELEAFLVVVNSLLVEGGLFVFDVVTEKHILRYWAKHTERERGEDWEMIRRGWYDKRGRCQHTEFLILSHEENKVFREHHSQQIYRLDELKATVIRSGFHIIGLFDGFTLKPGNEMSDRVHFVLQRGVS
jgi:SAM-dependent methyltransferase